MSKDQEQRSVLSDSQVDGYVRLANKEYYHYYQDCDEAPSHAEFDEITARAISDIQEECLDKLDDEQSRGKSHGEGHVFDRVRTSVETTIGNAEEFGNRFDYTRRKMEQEKEQAELEALNALEDQAVDNLPEEDKAKAKHAGGRLSLSR